MAKKVEEVKEKKAHVAKPKQANFSQFSNLNVNADAKTQTVSNKRLLKPILHSVGLTLGKSSPVIYNSANDSQFKKLLKNEDKEAVAYNMHKVSEHKFMHHVSKQTIL